MTGLKKLPNGSLIFSHKHWAHKIFVYISTEHAKLIIFDPPKMDLQDLQNDTLAHLYIIGFQNTIMYVLEKELPCSLYTFENPQCAGSRF